MKPLELIESIRCGREIKSSEGQLYALVRTALLARIDAKIPPRLRSRMDAEDVLQAAFLRALQALPTFQPRDDDSFPAWVYSIAKNLIADQGKRRSVAAVRFAQAEDQAGVRESQIAAGRQRPESVIQRREWIDSVLGQLKEKEADVIRLRWLEGYSFEEIAESWRKKAGAVQRFYARAWKRFCEIAKDEDG